jgi:DNA-binding winged helix-turn-helix (wHTH) protein
MFCRWRAVLPPDTWLTLAASENGSCGQTPSARRDRRYTLGLREPPGIGRGTPTVVKLAEPLVFPPFRLDLVNEQLWREHQLVPLRPKTFAVLRFLVEHAGRLLTKEELLKGVWPDTHVSEGILKGYIRDLRDILGDDAQQPRFIETLPRRGHRFIAAVVTAAPVPSSEFQVPLRLLPLTRKEKKVSFSNLEPGTWNLKPETWNVASGTRDRTGSA